MFKRVLFLFILLMVALTGVTACSSAEPVIVTQVVTQQVTVQVTKMVTAIPTNTPLASYTPTLVPTETPTPTETPDLVGTQVAATVAAALQKAGIDGADNNSGTGDGSQDPETWSTDTLTVTHSNGWTFNMLDGSNLDRGDGTTFWDFVSTWELPEISPELWPTFPNEPNPLVPEFRVINGSEVPDGVEYANPESNFCQQFKGQNCPVPVAARHYFYYTGSYDLTGMYEGVKCDGSLADGCELIIVNPGEVTADLLGIFDQGFRLQGRYWNGDELDVALWALSSHGANLMLNLNSDLNPTGVANAGANCSNPVGCRTLDVKILIISGNLPMVLIQTTVSR